MEVGTNMEIETNLEIGTKLEFGRKLEVGSWNEKLKVAMKSLKLEGR